MVAIFFFTISCCWTLFSHFLFVNRRFSLKFSFAHTLHYISTHGRETSSFTPRMICWNNDICSIITKKKRRRNSTYILNHLKIQWNLNKWIDLIFLGWKESYSFNPNETYSNNKITQRNKKYVNGVHFFSKFLQIYFMIMYKIKTMIIIMSTHAYQNRVQSNALIVKKISLFFKMKKITAKCPIIS